MQNTVIDILGKHGLVAHSFACNKLPANIQIQLAETVGAASQSGFLTLIANAGGDFWQSMTDAQRTSSTNPVDDFSAELGKQIITACNQPTASILYPGNAGVSLIKLGELAGWSSPSPLGLGIHPRFGLWFAYRLLLLSDKALLPESENRTESISPCVSCENTPCVTACPADAVRFDSLFDIQRCANHRLSEKSSCERVCLARSACPVAQQHQYSTEQYEHHMLRALKSMQRWAQDNPTDSSP